MGWLLSFGMSLHAKDPQHATFARCENIDFSAHNINGKEMEFILLEKTRKVREVEKKSALDRVRDTGV